MSRVKNGYKAPKYPLHLTLVETEKIKVPEKYVLSQHTERLDRALEGSLNEYGFIVPIIVVHRDSEFILVDGFHRLETAKKLGFKYVPAIVIEGAPEHEAQLLNFILNYIKGPMDKLSAIDVLAELVKKYSPEKLEKLTGKSKRWWYYVRDVFEIFGVDWVKSSIKNGYKLSELVEVAKVVKAHPELKEVCGHLLIYTRTQLRILAKAPRDKVLKCLEQFKEAARDLYVCVVKEIEKPTETKPAEKKKEEKKTEEKREEKKEEKKEVPEEEVREIAKTFEEVVSEAASRVFASATASCEAASPAAFADKLHVAVQIIEESREALRELEKLIKQYVSNLSHQVELINKLADIRNMLFLAAEEIRKVLEQVQQQA